MFPSLWGGIWIVLLFVFCVLIHQMTGGTLTQTRASFFSHDYDVMSIGVGICFLVFLIAHSSHCPFSHVMLFLRNDYCVLMLHSLLPAPISEPFSEFPLNTILPSLTMSL